MHRTIGPVTAAAVVVGVVRLLTIPRGFWSADEVRFAQALLTFDPFRQQPDFPGHPLYVALGRLVYFFVREPFAALVVLSVVSSVVAAVLIGRVAARLLGSEWSGAAVSVVLLLSPALLVFGPLPGPGSTALTFVAATLLALAAGKPGWFAASAAATIGVAPHAAPAMLVVVAIGLIVLERRLRAGAVFTIGLLVCFVPLAESVGTERMREWFDLLGRWRVPDFGSESRELLLRFTAHPWGGKSLSLPLLSAAIAGVTLSIRRLRTPAVAAIALFSLVHIVITLVAGDAHDGVNPALPALVAGAFFSVATFARWPAAAMAMALCFAIGSSVYVFPLLRQRWERPSPARAAVTHAQATLPAGVLLVADPELAPFTWLGGGRLDVVTPERFDDVALRAESVHLLMHGRSPVQETRIFEWEDSDAYGKLTTERFRVVSIVPQAAHRRYAGRSGLYAHESSPERGEWRWMGPEAVIELPQEGPTEEVELTLRLPSDAPIETNRVRVGEETVEIARGATTEVVVRPTREIDIRADRAFTARDGRRLSVQLVGVERR